MLPAKVCWGNTSAAFEAGPFDDVCVSRRGICHLTGTTSNCSAEPIASLGCGAEDICLVRADGTLECM